MLVLPLLGQMLVGTLCLISYIFINALICGDLCDLKSTQDNIYLLTGRNVHVLRVYWAFVYVNLPSSIINRIIRAYHMTRFWTETIMIHT